MNVKLLWSAICAQAAIVLVWIACGPIRKGGAPSARQEVGESFRRAPAPKNEAEPRAFTQLKEMIAERLEAGCPNFRHWIEFNGIVLDEDGNPVAGITVPWSRTFFRRSRRDGTGTNRPSSCSASRQLQASRDGGNGETPSFTGTLTQR